MNPGGSVKDRVAFQIINDAEASGALVPGGTIIEATSGNTGMGLALAAAIRGYKTIFVMPDKMSDEKIRSLRAFGAKVVITPTNVEPEDPRSYYCVAKKLVEDTPKSFYANQYHNPSNPRAHYLSTGPEIWEQCEGEIDVFVSAAGTGGTISGVGKYLKEQNPKVRVVAADPVGSLYYDYFHSGKLTEAHSYLVEGFGEDFLPTTMNFDYVDDVIRVSDRECFDAARKLVRREGIYAGGSSGGAALACEKIAEHSDRPLRIVTIMCDSASRYLSKVFNDDWMRENGFLEGPESNAIVADLLSRRGHIEVVTTSPDRSIRDVIAMMKDVGISQVPVIDGAQIKGIVGEKDLLQRLVGGDTPDSQIGEGSAKFAIVDPATRMTMLPEFFGREQTVLVLNDGNLIGVITKIDYIDYVTNT